MTNIETTLFAPGEFTKRMKEASRWDKTGVVTRLNRYTDDDFWLAARCAADADPEGFKRMAGVATVPSELYPNEIGTHMVDGVKDFYLHERVLAAIEQREAVEA